VPSRSWTARAVRGESRTSSTRASSRVRRSGRERVGTSSARVMSGASPQAIESSGSRRPEGRRARDEVEVAAPRLPARRRPGAGTLGVDEDRYDVARRGRRRSRESFGECREVRVDAGASALGPLRLREGLGHRVLVRREHQARHDAEVAGDGLRQLVRPARATRAATRGRRPQRAAVGAPGELELPAGERLAGVPLALAVVDDSLGSPALARSSDEPASGERALLGPSASDSHSGWTCRRTTRRWARRPW
jgi:hypothetical protein